jgi:glycogen debranching enzyme
MLVDRGAAFVVNPAADIADSRFNHHDVATVPYPTCAPDGSYFHATLTYGGAKITWTFGKLNDHAIGAVLTTDSPVTLPLQFLQPFGGCKTLYWTEGDGLGGNGYAANSGQTVPIHAHVQPPPLPVKDHPASQADLNCPLEPSRPSILVISLGNEPPPAFETVQPALDAAGKTYGAHRISAEGDWGDFTGAIADVMNDSRYFSSLDRTVAHAVGRGWWISAAAGGNADFTPYFGWDSNFNGDLGSLEDPVTSRDTIRAVFSLQDPEGMISNYSHWPAGDQYVAYERTDPPVAALCVWKMHQRWPDPAFLAEIYPKLVKWHDWWHLRRAKPGQFLLSWGSARNDINDARLETGWDDTQSFGDGRMVGNLLNEYNVDLNSLWAMDAENLAHIADALGHHADAARFRGEHARMAREMNARLWNESLGLYCNRSWNDNPDGSPHFITRITPMNFYPLICGAPDAARARRVLDYLHDPKKFWGDYLVPTLPYDDPDFHRQEYWHGHTWAPVNYLLWQGLVRYDDAPHLAEFARRSVNLFMHGWTTDARICSENYRSDTGAPDDDPHYTWGALLPLIGVEALVDVGPDLKPVPRQLGLKENLTLRHIPVGGKLYRIENKNGLLTVTAE